LRSSSRLHSPGKKRESLAACGRSDDNSITGNLAEMMTASGNLRANVFDHNARATIGGKQWHALPQQKAPLPRIGRRHVELGHTQNAQGQPKEQQNLSI